MIVPVVHLPLEDGASGYSIKLVAGIPIAKVSQDQPWTASEPVTPSIDLLGKPTYVYAYRFP